MQAFSAIPLSVYGAVPGIADPTLSPSGKYVALVATVNEKQKLLVVEPNGKVLYNGDSGDLKIRSLHWAGDDFVIVLYSTTQNLGYSYGFKHELRNILVVDLKQNRHFLPLDKGGSVNAIFGYYGCYRQNDRWYAYVGTLPLTKMSGGEGLLTQSDPRLTRIDLITGKSERVSEANKNGRGWLLNEKGDVIANERYDNNAKVWSLYAGAHDGKLLVQSRDTTGSYSIEGQGRSANTLVYASYDENDALHYMEIPLDGAAEPREILKDADAANLLFDPVSGRLNGYLKRGEQREVVLLNPAHAQRFAAAREAFPAHTVRFYSVSDDFNRIIVQTDGLDDSGTWWLVDINTGTADPVGYSYPAIAEKDVNPWQIVQYKAADGTSLEGILTTPIGKSAEKLPLVVMPHGGPEARDYPMFDWWAQAFASRGYAVFQPNFRGSAGYGAEFRNAGYGEYGRKMQTDVSDSVAELARKGIIDSARVCIVGASYGGYVALAGVTMQKDIYRCAVSVAGPSHLKLELTELQDQQRFGVVNYWLKYFGASDAQDKSLDTISPVKFAKQASAPVLLIHGEDDTVVLIEQSKIMRDALKDAGKPVEMITLSGEDHWLSLSATRRAMLEASISFVEKHLPVISK